MTNPDFNDANIVAVLKMPGNSSIKFEAADLIEVQAAQLAASKADTAQAVALTEREQIAAIYEHVSTISGFAKTAVKSLNAAGYVISRARGAKP